jgi:hypothetical protein
MAKRHWEDPVNQNLTPGAHRMRRVAAAVRLHWTYSGKTGNAPDAHHLT